MFRSLFLPPYSKEDMVRSLSNKLEFASIGDENACWLKRVMRRMKFVQLLSLIEEEIKL